MTAEQIRIYEPRSAVIFVEEDSDTAVHLDIVYLRTKDRDSLGLPIFVPIPVEETPMTADRIIPTANRLEQAASMLDGTMAQRNLGPAEVEAPEIFVAATVMALLGLAEEMKGIRLLLAEQTDIVATTVNVTTSDENVTRPTPVSEAKTIRDLTEILTIFKESGWGEDSIRFAVDQVFPPPAPAPQISGEIIAQNIMRENGFGDRYFDDDSIAGATYAMLTKAVKEARR